MKQLYVTILIMFSVLLLGLPVWSGPGGTTYQAKIIKPDGVPLEASSVNFKFTILDPLGTCILYSETFSSVNMSSTSGLISFSLGTGIKTYPVSSTTFENVFSNSTPSLSCDSGGPVSYSPLATDIRKIVMQFHDGSGWQTLPAMAINAVPYAMYASESQKLSGLAASDFVQVSTVPTCATSEALRYTGAGFSCVAVGGGGGGSVTSGSVISALGYTPADGASVTAVTSTVASLSAIVSGLVSATNLQSLNGSTSGTQSFAIGTGGIAPAFNTSNGIHTLNLPYASAGATTAGLISNSDYLTFSNKMNATSAAVINALGYTPASSTALGSFLEISNNLSDIASAAVARINLDLGLLATKSQIDLSSTDVSGTLSSANLPDTGVTAATYTKVTVDSKGRVTSGSQFTASDVAAALGYTPANSATVTGSQWSTSGTTINYMVGNVGIGTSAPFASLDVNGRVRTLSGVVVGGSAGSLLNGYIFRVGALNVCYNADCSTQRSFFTMNDASNYTNITSKVGINFSNATAPLASLHVSNQIGGDSDIRLTNSTIGNTATDGLYFLESTSGNTTIRNYESGTFTIGTGAASSALTIDSSGKVGIGITVPTAKLELTSGTASVAPLKLTSGTLLTSPQSGTIEYDGFNFYITDSTNTRRTIATASTPGTIDNANNINATTNMTLTPVGSVIVSATTESTSSNTGALVVKGGLGVAGNINTAGNLNVSGSSVIDGSLKLSSLTSGSVLFAGSNGTISQDNASFYWDGANKRLGLGTTSPSFKLEVSGSATSDRKIGINGKQVLYLPEQSTSSGSMFVGDGGASENGYSNTGVGVGALYSNTSGSENTATGNLALYSNTTGTLNTANGNGALYSNIWGSENTATGYEALYLNTYGNENTATGNLALQYNTTGSQNAAYGNYALRSNDTGTENTATGHSALYANTTGYQNTANGSSALLSNTTGSNNTANGADALRYNTDGYENTATGHSALQNNTTGDYNTANGSYALRSNTEGGYNTANGYQALFGNTTGFDNTATGESGLYSNTMGNGNAAYGNNALYSNKTGNYNIAVGNYALYSNTTGSSNTANGYFSLYTNKTKSESTAIGYYSMRYADSVSAAVTSSYNTAVGAYSLQGSITASINTGVRNTALGHSSLKNMTSGSSNTAIGYNAGSAITTGNNNVILGSDDGSSIATSSNYVLIADGAGNRRMTIDGGGNIGIGTTNPAHRLDVVGGSVANDTSFYFTQLNSASAKFNAVQLDPYVSVATSGSETTGLSIGTKIGGTTTWSVDFADNIYTYVPINANAGSTYLNRNVASTSAHSLAFYKRRPSGSVLANDNLAWIPGYGHTGSGWASTYSAAIGMRATENITGSAAGGQLWFETTPNGTTTPQNRMTIDQNGYVGIGLTAPSNILSISTLTSADGISLSGVQTAGNTTNVAIRTNLGAGSFNGLTQAGDSGIIYSGLTVGTAKGFVIAPWIGSTAGIRMDGSGNVGIGTATPNATLEVNGHLAISSASTPALSSCGTSPTISGNDIRGTVTTGGGAVSCTITFSSAFSTSPYCVIGDVGANNGAYLNSISTSAMVVNLGQNKTFNYICMQ